MPLKGFFRRKKPFLLTLGAGILALSIASQTLLKEEQKEIVKEVTVEQTISNKFSKKELLQKRKELQTKLTQLSTTTKKLDKIEEKLQKQLSILENEDYHQEGHIYNQESLEKEIETDKGLREVIKQLFKIPEKDLKDYKNIFTEDLATWVEEGIVKRLAEKYSLPELELLNLTTQLNDEQKYTSSQPFPLFLADKYLEMEAYNIVFWKQEKIKLLQLKRTNEDLLLSLNEASNSELNPQKQELYELQNKLEAHLLTIDDYLETLEESTETIQKIAEQL